MVPATHSRSDLFVGNSEGQYRDSEGEAGFPSSLLVGLESKKKNVCHRNVCHQTVTLPWSETKMVYRTGAMLQIIKGIECAITQSKCREKEVMAFRLYAS